MVLSKLRAGTYPSNSWDALTTCIYCGKRVKTPTGLSRHIALRPYCQAVRDRWAIRGNPYQRQKSRSPTPLATGGEGHGAYTDEYSPFVAGSSMLPVSSLDMKGVITHLDLGSDSDSDSDDDASGRPCVKHLPTSTTIAPMTTRRRVEIEPRANGPLRNPDLPATTKAPAPSGLTGGTRTKDSEQPTWKMRGTWINKAKVSSEIEGIPKGLRWKKLTAELELELDERAFRVGGTMGEGVK
ncbi:hypothetical protein FRC07_010389 [Ceratobasidium sp. 392]|nr:hypothetical protein FRC07_010389 [Ceratobasidium sp. 392]